MSKHYCGKKNCTRAVKNEGDMCWQHKGLEDQIAAGSVAAEVVHIPLTQEGVDSFSADTAEAVIEREVATPAAPEAVYSAPKLTGLAALLRTPPPITPLDGLLIPFSREEIISLIEAEVTADHIRELVIIGLSVGLMEFSDEDPLAKSRCHAAG